MSGIAPAAFYLSAALIGGLGVVWLALKMFKPNAAPAVGKIWLATTVLCIAYLFLDKLVGVGYTVGLYGGIGIAVVVGGLLAWSLRRR